MILPSVKPRRPTEMLKIPKPIGTKVDPDAIEFGKLFGACVSPKEALLRRWELGRKLKAKRLFSLNHGEWLPWLKRHKDVLGFNERTAQLLMDFAEANTQLPAYLELMTEEEVIEKTRELWGHAKYSLPFGGDNNEWGTPAYLVRHAAFEGEVIDLDPASTYESNKIIKAKKIYTKEQDGLRLPWKGRVFLNPPFSPSQLLRSFVCKLRDQYKNGNVSEAILLTHNSTESSWFQQEICENASALCFTRSRTKFLDLSCGGNEKGSNLRGQVLSYFGAGAERFASEYQNIGAVVRIA
jgi:hypothetical protein